MIKFEVINYDVWGNEEEGFEVNGSYTTGYEIEISDTASDKEIIDALKEIEFLSNKCNENTVDIDGETEFSLYLEWSKNSYPLCELRRVYNRD